MKKNKKKHTKELSAKEKHEIERREKEKKYSTKRQAIVNFFIGLAVVVVGIVALFFFVLGVSRVDGESMLPTLANNETLIFNRLSKEYHRGDIICITMPNGDYYVKRVIGIAGDEVNISGGQVMLNGQVLNEPYIQGSTYPVSELVSYPLIVEEGKVFAMGDNREHSTDSREIGQVSFYAISGKIMGGKQ